MFCIKIGDNLCKSINQPYELHSFVYHINNYYLIIDILLIDFHCIVYVVSDGYRLNTEIKEIGNGAYFYLVQK